MYSDTLLESLIRKIYEAAGAGTGGWASFLTALAAALDSSYPSLYFADTCSPGSEIAVSVGMDEPVRRSYKQHYAQKNIWLLAARAQNLLRPGIVRTSQRMCPQRQFLQSEWYSDFCKPLKWSQGLGATVLQEGTVTSNIGVFADESRPPYDEEDFILIRALMPHLQRGLKMQMHLTASQAREQALEAALDGLSMPVLLVSTDGKVVFLNRAAERLIRASDGLRIVSGELHALRPNDTRSLRALVESAARTSAGEGKKAGGRMRVTRPFGRDPLNLAISPIVARNDAAVLKHPQHAVIFISDPERSATTNDAVLMGLHGLTAAEARVASALSRGLSGSEICRELEIGYNTLKTHLKRIYGKTQTKRQGDLVRLIVGGLRLSDADDIRGSSAYRMR